MKRALFAALLLCASATAHAQSAAQSLDAAVLRAIHTGDLRHARELAVTPQHWQWINDASSPGASRPTYMQTRKDMANSQACKDAQRSAQLSANMIKPDWQQVATARESARVACGY